ncbi:MAG TPA: hydrogenase maturation protein [Sulfuricaulis sp.]|nr:hydrogenase maturation protein [Sulfuricaulis sp.]
MRILFLTHSFNSLTQRLYVELTQRGHDVSIEFDINDAVTLEAVQLFRPDLIVAPYLRRAIPDAIWRRHLCLVVHPGIKGDRGPSALDWAILNGEGEWGVTVLQADAEMDAGPVWASVNFPMRAARKSSLYRNEVTEAAVTVVLQAIDRFENGKFIPEQLNESCSETRGKWRPLVKPSDRRIDWLIDDTQTVLRKIHSADGFPGIEDALLGVACQLYDACEEDTLHGAPGEIIARRHGAVCRATRDGAVWIGHVKKIVPGEKTFKLPATLVLHDRLGEIPESTLAFDVPPACHTYKDIWYGEKAGVGYLHFDFYNGAMNAEQCQRLREAYLQACRRPTRVIVLMGGPDFWSNGIHLNCIEAADSPADESWRNINAMDDLAQAIIKTDSHLTIAALQGNTAAGGVFLALAADRLYAREGVVLNPHYKNMGNLYGSEYWSYLLPKRIGKKGREIMENRLPLGATAAKHIGLIDDCFGGSVNEFTAIIKSVAETLAADPNFETQLEARRRQRAKDETVKPLEAYRIEELDRMKLNFYGFDPSYHVARYNFVFRVPHSWTPLHLARHRQRIKNANPANADASSRSISAARKPALSAD